MAIADDDIERIRSTVSIVDVIGQHVQLKRTGRNWVGLCPFHAERTPSFNVREETGRYKCFGCDKSGDVFTFVQEIEHTDFAAGSVQLTFASLASVYLSPGFWGGIMPCFDLRSPIAEVVERGSNWTTIGLRWEP